jgi:methyl-accepting chemotaxis protein
VAGTNEGFSEVAQSVSKADELVGEIAAASNEQSQGIDQINRAVAEMDKVIQQNAANAEESASASEEMNAQAEQMKSFAQAEQMKSFVGDLMALVGGNGGSKVRSKEYGVGSMGKGAGSAVGAIRKAITPSAKKSKALAVPKTREVRPDEVIPMDDGDFKDF